MTKKRIFAVISAACLLCGCTDIRIIYKGEIYNYDSINAVNQ